MHVAPRAFGGLDWLMVAAYAAAVIGIGFYYSRRQRTTEEYFLAGRNKRPFLAGLAGFSAIFTILSYIATPGEFVAHGPVIVCVLIASLPLHYLLVGRIMIPAIMRLPITSAYELLEGRLGLPVRLTGSITFVCVRLAWMALMLYTAAMVLISVMGWDPRVFPMLEIAIGLITTLYTFVGGMEAVMLTAVMQFLVLIVGALLTIASITWRMGGISAWWPHHWQPFWAPEPFFSFDPHVRVTVVSSVVSSCVFMLCVAGSDQVMVQRYLTTRNAAAARRSYLLNNVAIGCISVTLGLVGAALLGFYSHHAVPGLSLEKNGDAFFPHYISHFLPPGVSGLVVAGMMGSAILALGSAINSIAAVISKDFVDTFRPGRTETEKVRTARILAILVGIVIVALSTLVGAVPGNLIEVQVKTIHLFICPMFGLFFLAMFVPFATPFGAISGAVYSLAAGILFAYWDVITGLPRLSFQWITTAALVVSLSSGTLLSLLPTRGRSRGVILAYGAVTFAPLAALIVWLARR